MGSGRRLQAAGESLIGVGMCTGCNLFLGACRVLNSVPHLIDYVGSHENGCFAELLAVKSCGCAVPRGTSSY